MEQGWSREEAQLRAAWSRSGASEWESAGAAQPSADDDEYLKAAREAQSKRIGTLTIPVPDADFDSLDFETAGEEQQKPHLDEVAIPLPAVGPGARTTTGGADVPAQLDAPPAPQWYPPRQPVAEIGGRTHDLRAVHPDHFDVRPTDRTNVTNDSDEMQRRLSPSQPVHERGHDHLGGREEHQTIPEPEPDLELLAIRRVRSQPSFADE